MPDPTPVVSRRHFLVMGAGGLTLGVAMLAACSDTSGSDAAGGDSPNTPATGAATTTTLPAGSLERLNAWVHVGEDGRVWLSYGGSEMGQGTMTALCQILAEELRIPWSEVNVDRPVAGQPVSYFTGASTAIRVQYAPLARAGAAAREMLVAAAATQLGVSVSECTAADGAVTATVGGKDRTLSYGAVATLAATLPVPDDPPLTPVESQQVIGRPVPRLDIPAKVTGTAVYGLDVRVPDMVFAAMLAAPALGATLDGAPSVPADAIDVVPITAHETRGAIRQGDIYAVAAVANDTWTAIEASRTLELDWTTPATTSELTTRSLRQQANQLLAGDGALLAEPSQGDVDAALSAASDSLDVTYSLPYLAHACMEVQNCTVDVGPTSCEIWAPTQVPAMVVDVAAAQTGLAPEAITVHTTFLGGGLGRRIEVDFVAAALQVGMAIGRPVMLMYPREQDFALDQFRPTAQVRVHAGVADGAVTAWSYRNVSSSILGQRGLPAGAPDGQATEGSIELPYDLGATRVEWVPDPAGIPVGYWRSVAFSINTFAVESTIDQLAEMSGSDPFAFRRRLLAGRSRELDVIDAVDTLSNWRRSLERDPRVGPGVRTLLWVARRTSHRDLPADRWRSPDPPCGLRRRLRPNHQSRHSGRTGPGRHRPRAERRALGRSAVPRRTDLDDQLRHPPGSPPRPNARGRGRTAARWRPGRRRRRDSGPMRRSRARQRPPPTHGHPRPIPPALPRLAVRGQDVGDGLLIEAKTSEAVVIGGRHNIRSSSCLNATPG